MHILGVVDCVFCRLRKSPNIAESRVMAFVTISNKKSGGQGCAWFLTVLDPLLSCPRKSFSRRICSMICSRTCSRTYLRSPWWVAWLATQGGTQGGTWGGTRGVVQGTISLKQFFFLASERYHLLVSTASAGGFPILSGEIFDTAITNHSHSSLFLLFSYFFADRK